jgi:hypothetical protein
VVLTYRRTKLFCCNAAKIVDGFKPKTYAARNYSAANAAKIVGGFNLPPRETILLMLEPTDKPGTYVQGEFAHSGEGS